MSIYSSKKYFTSLIFVAEGDRTKRFLLQKFPSLRQVSPLQSCLPKVLDLLDVGDGGSVATILLTCCLLLFLLSVQVEELARLSLHQPVRVFVDNNTVTADNLQQEFVRIRPAREADREAIVAGKTVVNFVSYISEFVRLQKHYQC